MIFGFKNSFVGAMISIFSLILAVILFPSVASLGMLMITFLSLFWTLKLQEKE